MIATAHNEGMHITLHHKPRKVNCRTPRFAYMPKGRGLTKFLLKPISFGFSQLKEADPTTTFGSFTLRHDTGADGYCPMHMYSLGTIQNRQTSAESAGFEYKDNGTHDTLANTEMTRLTDVTSNNGEGVEDVSNHQLIWRKAEINMLLYQRTHQSTTFDITFYKLVESQLDPNSERFNASGYSSHDVQNYWNPIVMRYTQNPATLAKPYPSAQLVKTAASVRVLKKFRVEIREKLSTEDTLTKRTVKFVLYPNQLQHYDHSLNNQVSITDVTGEGTDAMVNQVGTFIGGDINNSWPRTTNNIFMSISANAYADTTEINGNDYDNPTYDIAMRTTYDAVNSAP